MLRRMAFFFLVAITGMGLFLFVSGCSQPLVDGALDRPGIEKTNSILSQLPGSVDLSKKMSGTNANARSSAGSFYDSQYGYVPYPNETMHPSMRWFFNSTDTAPTFYHYTLKYWMYSDYYGRWFELPPNQNVQSLRYAGQSKLFVWEPAQWVIGLVEGWMCSDDGSSVQYLGYAYEGSWTYVEDSQY